MSDIQPDSPAAKAHSSYVRFRKPAAFVIVVCSVVVLLASFSNETDHQIARLDEAKSELLVAAEAAAKSAHARLPPEGSTIAQLQQAAQKTSASLTKLENDYAQSRVAQGNSNPSTWQSEPWLTTAKVDAAITVERHLLARTSGQLEFARHIESMQQKRTDWQAKVTSTSEKVIAAQKDSDALATKLEGLNTQFATCDECVAAQQELNAARKQFHEICEQHQITCHVILTAPYNRRKALDAKIATLISDVDRISNGLSSKIAEASDQVKQLKQNLAGFVKARDNASAKLADIEKSSDAARARIPTADLALNEAELSGLTATLDKKRAELEQQRYSNPSPSFQALAWFFGALLLIVIVSTIKFRLGAGTLRRGIVQIALLFALVIAWRPSLDYPAVESVDAGARRAFAAFAVARSLNALVSLAQGTQFTPPLIDNFTFSVGEFLDPANDLIEDFSNVMLAATVAFSVQKLLLVIGQYWVVKWFLSGIVVVWGALYWANETAPRRLTQLMLLMLMVRFAVPVVTVGSDALYTQFLQTQYQQAQAGLEEEARNLDSAVSILQAREDSGGVLGRLNPMNYMHRIKDVVDRTVTHAINVMAVFAMQTVLVPLLLLWILYATLRAALVRQSSNQSRQW